MKGELVIVRCVGDEQRVVTVWEDLGDVVLVCGASSEAIAEVSRGEIPPIGFKREDVFQYPAGGAPGRSQWSDLARY